MIQKYTAIIAYGEPDIEEDDAGNLVSYADHLAEVAALREKLQTIEAETIERCAKLCDEQLTYDDYDPCEFFASVIRKMTPIQQSKDSAQGEK